MALALHRHALRGSRRSRRRGAVLIYATLAVMMVIAFASLAMDWGRVTLVRSELMYAAEVAARDATSNLTSDPATARNAAIGVAALNRADGEPVVLTAADVELGR